MVSDYVYSGWFANFKFNDNIVWGFNDCQIFLTLCIIHMYKQTCNVLFCLVTGVYAFGFLFMLPQLFVNYKVRKCVFLNK